MDQNRLEELKRLLQKRHQEPKRGLEQNSDGENFEAPNSEIQNSEVSNFEALNSEVSNFESLNPGASNSEFPNSEISNYETQNSKAPNSDPDALNLETELETEAAQNSVPSPASALDVAFVVAFLIHLACFDPFAAFKFDGRAILYSRHLKLIKFYRLPAVRRLIKI